jgi:hypothetical protein
MLDSIPYNLNKFTLISRNFNGPFKLDDYFNDKFSLFDETNDKHQFYKSKYEFIKNNYPNASEIEEIIESYRDNDGILINKFNIRISSLVPIPKIIEPIKQTLPEITNIVPLLDESRYSKSNLTPKTSTISIKAGGYRPPSKITVKDSILNSL